jgi:hypothetical protein
MLQAEYPGVSRHQENMFRRTDIELIEAGLPLARKLTYMPKRGPKTRSKITTLVPVEFEVPNVGRVISETFLFGRLDKAEASKSQASNQKGDAE